MDEAGHAYHAALLKVLDALHHVTAAALGLKEDYFAPFYAPSAKCSLRLAYYPPLSTTQQTSSAVRYGAHTDYTGYTILCQDDNDVGALDAGGLQVLAQVGAVGGGHAATERLRREHRGLVRGLDERPLAQHRAPGHEASIRIKGGDATAPLDPLLHGAPRRRPDLVPADVRVRSKPGEVRARVGGRAPAEEVGDIGICKYYLAPVPALDVALRLLLSFIISINTSKSVVASMIWPMSASLESSSRSVASRSSA